MSYKRRNGRALARGVGLTLHPLTHPFTRVLAPLRRHWVLLPILAIFIFLATTDNLVTPPFEGTDEHRHYAYVRHLAQGRGFPPRDVPITDNVSYGAFQEAGQPPLYYAIAALVTVGIPGADRVEAALRPNAHFGFPAPVSRIDNRNLWLRSAGRRSPLAAMDPGFLLAIHSARVVSLWFGVVAVLGTYGLGLVCFDGDRELASWSAAWVAFNPKFVFISSVISSDSASAALGTLALWKMAVWMARGPSMRVAVIWGVTLGFCALTRNSLVGILPICAVGFWMGLRGERTRRVIWHAAFVGGLAMLIGGWWYVRGVVIFGDPLGLSLHLRTPWARQRPDAFINQLPGVLAAERSYWAGFGWVNSIQPPEWVLQAVLGWEHIGLLGLCLHVWRSRHHTSPDAPGWRWRLVVLLLAWLFVLLVALLWWMRTMGSGMGRLMFPAVAPLAILLVMGWQGWLPSRGRRFGLGAMTVVLLGFAVAASFVVIPPAYARPPQLSAAELAALEERPPIIFESAARLLAAEPNPATVYPGEWTWVRLCWESVAPLDRDYEVFLHFLGLENRLAAVRHTHTGLGRFPTSAWQPGDVFCDVVQLRVEDWAPAPAVYEVEVGLCDQDTGDRLEARDQHGDVVAPVFVNRVKVWAREPLVTAPPHRTDYLLGDQIELVGYSVEPVRVRGGEAFTLSLYWRADRRPKADFTVFVQLFNEAGQLVAQADGPPQGSVYPTSWWEPGDEVIDVRQVDLPPAAGEGGHHLVVGLYRWPTMERLPVIAGDGTRVPDGAIRLTEVVVVH